MTHAARVRLCEVGPRDGFQFERTPIDTATKIRALRELAAAGLPRIQATSFVHAGRVPQMADAEAVAEAVLGIPGPEWSALALNLRGVERALSAGFRCVDLSIATNESHARDNVGRTVEQGVDEAEVMLRAALDGGCRVQLGLQTVFGYAQTGDTPLELVTGIVRRFAGYPLESLSLADTTGRAGPEEIRRTVEAVAGAVPGVELVLHLHDTRGLGLVNIATAHAVGVTRFDTAFGGLGGCPFIPGATGNVATEDACWLFERMGLHTGVDRSAVAQVSRRLSSVLGRPLPGRLWSLDA